MSTKPSSGAWSEGHRHRRGIDLLAVDGSWVSLMLYIPPCSMLVLLRFAPILQSFSSPGSRRGVAPLAMEIQHVARRSLADQAVAPRSIGLRGPASPGSDIAVSMKCSMASRPRRRSPAGRRWAPPGRCGRWRTARRSRPAAAAPHRGQRCRSSPGSSAHAAPAAPSRRSGKTPRRCATTGTPAARNASTTVSVGEMSSSEKLDGRKMTSEAFARSRLSVVMLPARIDHHVVISMRDAVELRFLGEFRDRRSLAPDGAPGVAPASAGRFAARRQNPPTAPCGRRRRARRRSSARASIFRHHPSAR